MTNAEKRAALQYAIERLRAELAALPADDGQGSDDYRSTDNGAAPSRSVDGGPFRGRPLFAKRGGTCAVCRGSIESGAPALWNGDRKQIAHARCGEDDGRGPR